MASSSIFFTVCFLMSVVWTFGLLNVNMVCNGNGQDTSIMCGLACSCAGQNTAGCINCCNLMVRGGLCTDLSANSLMYNPPLGGVPIVCKDGVQMDDIKGTICDCCFAAGNNHDICTSVGVPNNYFWNDFFAICGNL